MLLRLLTWNIHRAIGMDRRFRPERVIEVIRHHDPDLLLMQEVDRGVPRSHRLWLDHLIAKEAGYPFHAWAQAHVLAEGAYGNATLSRFPMAKRRHVDLTIGRRKRRLALYTRLRLPGLDGHLHLFNWHLGLSASERDRQVEHLLASGTLRDLPEASRILLGGDTNDWRNLLFPSRLRPAGFHAWSEHGRRRHVRTYPSTRPVGALDKFFWRGPLGHEHIYASRLRLARTASDHLPLVAEFELLPA